MNIREKHEQLQNLIRNYEKAAVAFSGGVDSSFLARVCKEVQGEQALAITLVSPMSSRSEIQAAQDTAREIGIRHILIEDNTLEQEVASNPADRCYHCKKIEFGEILKKAGELGSRVLLEGSNADDMKDYRPGLKAVAELGVKSPLRELGLTKDEIRTLSKELGLSTWDKPAMACLASRIPYGETITREKLKRVEKAEDYLRSRGFRQFRVRSHGEIARIEVAPNEREKWFDTALMDEVSRNLKSYGFLYIALELEGYRSGSLNRVISS